MVVGRTVFGLVVKLRVVVGLVVVVSVVGALPDVLIAMVGVKLDRLPAVGVSAIVVVELSLDSSFLVDGSILIVTL